MDYLKKTFRWFGPSFGVSLPEIKQLGVEGIVTACGHIPIGEVWPMEDIASLKNEIIGHGMEWSVVESVNIHNAIKYGLPERDKFIENYIHTLKHLAAHGIFTVCYNFMALFDWTRTHLQFQLPTGAISMLYDPNAIAAFDLYILKREKALILYTDEQKEKATAYFENLNADGQQKLAQAILIGMPGTKEHLTLEHFERNLQALEDLDKTTLQNNLAYFLNAVIPEVEKLGVKMAIHPDDPPFPVFGIPRVVSTYEDLQSVFDCCPSPSNGLTFCSGSFGASENNNLIKIIQDFGDKIHFIHLRNVEREGGGRFYESSHLEGSVPMAEVMRELVQEQRRRLVNGNLEVAIPMRPDHGHVVLDDRLREEKFYPGYSLIGRAMGMAELKGLEVGVRNSLLLS
ncbi:mannonate dehydratase [Flagellimonas algicola]|uniref:Mannonate dehydratase n=1 Tax=Flagellimonas algicola TaxID=2583815 RepID=A0ABY2WR63_9FLAO|nr:mannonate dehydratase [Allomuricauda algicola]TMU57498.1 mannonate dehydratase [Allomuricauda algicola]